LRFARFLRRLIELDVRILQSIFSSAARRCTPRDIARNAGRRDGELKMDWTKPLDDARPYGC